MLEPKIYHIDFVKKDKDRLVKLVEPDFIYNRFDIFYDNQYELIEIKTDDKTYYVPIHKDVYTAKLGLYMTELPQDALNKLIEFVFKHYTEVDFIEIRHSLTPYNGLKEGKQWTMELPETEDEYLAQLSYETRRHVRRYSRRIANEYKYEFKVFDKDIPSEVIRAFFKYKYETLGHKYTMSEQQYLKEYQVTKAFVIYLDDKIASVSLVCEIDNSNEVYYENFSYDKNYSKLSFGMVTVFQTVRKMIEAKVTKFYLAGGDYIYKKQLCNKCDKTYNGTIKRTAGKGVLRRKLFQYGQNDSFYLLRLFGLKLKKRKKKENCPLEINKDTKCLMVCPHPDDEMLGAGALLIKYSDNFDCICMGSSGVATPDIDAKSRSKIRMQEFHDVMNEIGVKNHWIFETYGIPRFDKQMDAHFDEYCEILKNLKNYDYIFLPHPQDGHHEHRYITNKLFKKIAKKVGINPNTKIVFYEVWKDMKKPNVFFDTSKDGFLYSKNGFKKYQNAYSKLLGTTEDSLLEWKYKILSMYKSQWRYNSMFSVQTMRTKCINNGKNPIWRFKVVSVKKYL